MNPASTTAARAPDTPGPKDAATDSLERMQAVLMRSDLAHLVRYHRVFRLTDGAAPAVEFHALQVSAYGMIAPLLQACAVDARSWLAKPLSETLDRRLLRLLSQPDEPVAHGDFRIRLNLATILSETFLDFDVSLGAAQRGRIIIAVSAADVSADVDGFRVAARLMADRNYRLCLDGLTVLTAGIIDAGALGFDYVDLGCDTQMPDDAGLRRQWLARQVAGIGRKRLILSQVDSAAALSFGLAAGVELFEGRAVDLILSAGKGQHGHRELHPAPGGGT